jgi:hypothetical protein
MRENKEKIRKKIINFVKKEYKKSRLVPSAREIDKKLNISFRNYFPNGKLRKKIIRYIQSEVCKEHYPTRLEIEEKFHTNIQCSIRKLYELTGVEYKRDPNPFLRYEKEKRSAETTQKLLTKSGYKIKSMSIGPSRPNGADIFIEDKKRQLIPVEIKAYQKFGRIGHAENSPYIKNKILQLKRYIKNLKAPYGYLITSTDKKTIKTVPPNIRILFGKDIRKLLLQFKMDEGLKDLDWIRNPSVFYGKKRNI